MHTKTIKNVWTLVAFAILITITPARAASTNYWINSAGGSWSVGANWSSGTAPGGTYNGGDVVYFTNNASYQVTISTVYPDAVYFNASSGVVTNSMVGGGLIECDFGGYNVGDSAGSTATVVQVGGQIYTLSKFYIGNQGQGSFTANGGYVSAVAGLGVVVGAGTSSGNFFMLTNGATGNQTANAIIGYGAGSGHNTAIETGTNTSWVNVGNAYLGYGGGAFNTLRIENGASFAQAYTTYLGYGAGSSNNTMIVTGSNTLWYTYFPAGGPQVRIGESANAGNNSLIVSNGATMRFAGDYVFEGINASAGGNQIIVTGPGSTMMVTNAGSGSASANLSVGYQSANNSVLIENGGKWMGGAASYAYIGDFAASASNNTVTVTGSNSLFQTRAADFRVGNFGGNNSLIVSNGAKVQLDGGASWQLVGTFGAGNNLVKVSGPGSSLYWTNTTYHMALGYQAPNNRLVIENGGQMFSMAGTGSDRFHVGEYSTSPNNSILVTGTNSFWGINAGSGASPEFMLGWGSGGNTLTVSNGAKVRFDGNYFEIGNSTANNSVTVTGAGSTFSNAAANFYVGYNGSNNRLLIDNGGQFYGSNMIVNLGSANRIQVLSGGLLDANILNAGAAANSISNFGGIYQFSTATPTITKNGANIVLTNGTVSFRDVAAADVKGNWTGTQLTNIAFQGNNTFRLNNSSNATSGQDYTFNTGLGATNYVALEMVNGNTLWRSAQLTIGTNGTMLASNTIGTVAAALTSQVGSVIKVYHSTMTYQSNVVINGKYVSDPSTNTFFADVTVGQSGTLAGGAGDLFEFKKSLFIHSTNNIGFNLATSAVKFSGGGMHTNAITGADLGRDPAAYNAAFLAQTNFAYGELHLGSASDQICFTCGNIPSIASNGLYVGWLDLLGNASLVTNLHAASGINIYYNMDDTRNDYLNDMTYQLTDCNFALGGGYLIAIPEPSALLMIGAAAVLFLCRKSKRA